MRKTVYELCSELLAVGVYHDVEACCTVIGSAMDDMAPGTKYYREDGGVLLVRGLHNIDDGRPVYEMAFDVIEDIFEQPPADTPEAFYEEELITDDDYSDPEFE